MSKRREFSKAVKVEIIKRATVRGVVLCEGCGQPTRHFDFDHTTPDAMQIDKSKPLTAKDGKVLCSGSPETCHDKKTAEEDIPAIARAKRVEAKHLGIVKTTALAGRTPEEKREAKRAGGKPSLPPRPLFVAALPAPVERRRG